MQKTVAIVGKGAWGRALYHVVSQNTKQLQMLGRGDICTDDIIILAVPTQSLREVRELIQTKNKQPIIINTAKGIERLTHMTPQAIIKEQFPDCHYYALIGPSFAEEVIMNMPTIVNLGYETDSRTNEEVRNLFQTDYFRVKLTEGVAALELSAALKNVYAIGCGYAEGLGYQTNTRIQLVMLAIEEVQRLFQSLELNIDRNALPGTIGDLILTCNSSESRNFRFGKYLTECTPDESLEKVGSTVEGYGTLNSLRYLEMKAGISLPLAHVIKRISVHQKRSEAKKLFQSFITKS